MYVFSLYILSRPEEAGSLIRVSDRLAFWERPAVWTGPLGIATWMQLSFFIMFIALLIWTLATYLKTNFGRLKPSGGMTHGGMAHGGGMADQPSMDLQRIKTASFRLAFVGTLSCAFLFFPVTLGSSILPLFGLCSEASVKYHVWLGHITLALFAAHSLGYIIYGAIIGDMCEMVQWAKEGVADVAGELAMVFGLVLRATTFRQIRRKSNELFLYTHQLYALFMFFFLLHVGISFYFLVLPGVYLFLLNRYLRLQYSTVSYVFICVPSFFKLQWHPFTINSSSNLEPETLSLIIKHDCLVLVSGGSGITPYFAMIRELIFMSVTKGVSVPKVRLICAFKTVADLSMLDLLLPLSTDKLDASRLDLTIDAYVTREKEAGKVGIKTVQTLPLKPLRSDRPITGILGPNSWLWLGAVIASSFVLFLLLLGIVGRCYIYTTEKESDAEFSTSIEAILALIFMCVSITGLGGAAFLWARKNASALAAKIENFDVVSPMGSPKSAFGNAELESHPQEVLKRAITVHYGERPDLQKILLQFEKWDCGVLASGPRGLRGDVARICSSGLADNLHFHSISFTW
ncbi:ferric reduction oxidase 2-like [Wolffia australiana]